MKPVIKPLGFAPFLPGVWRSKPLAGGTILEIRAVNRGSSCVYYDAYELANEDASGDKLRAISGNPKLASLRADLRAYARMEYGA